MMRRAIIATPGIAGRWLQHLAARRAAAT